MMQEAMRCFVRYSRFTSFMWRRKLWGVLIDIVGLRHSCETGSCDVFSSLIGAKGKDVLYVGDHIFGDILKSKKTRGWRTFLVVPEMTQELYVWVTKRHLVDQLQDLELKLSEAYLTMDSRSTTGPDTTEIRNSIQVSAECDAGCRRSYFGVRHSECDPIFDI